MIIWAFLVVLIGGEIQPKRQKKAPKNDLRGLGLTGVMCLFAYILLKRPEMEWRR